MKVSFVGSVRACKSYKATIITLGFSYSLTGRWLHSTVVKLKHNSRHQRAALPTIQPANISDSFNVDDYLLKIVFSMISDVDLSTASVQ